MPIGKAPQAFPRAEYLRRLAAVKAEMARREVDALVVSSSANITYLTGNLTRMFSIHALVVSAREEEPTLVVRGIDSAGTFHHTFLARESIVAYSDDFVGRPDRNGYDAIADLLIGRGHGTRGVGIELGTLSALAAEKFKARLPQARLVDCSRAVDWVRLVKSDLEIAMMREAAALVDAAILRAAEVIRPGVREADAAAEIVKTQIVGDGTGSAATGVLPLLLCASPRTGVSHILWSEDKFRPGSQINIELSGIRHGYYAAIMRTFVLGTAPDRLRRLHEAEVAGLEAALATVKPGRTPHDVVTAFYTTLEKQGFKKETRCGYPIGIDWVEPTASLQRGDTTELKPNMTFHLMLAIGWTRTSATS